MNKPAYSNETITVHVSCNSHLLSCFSLGSITLLGHQLANSIRCDGKVEKLPSSLSEGGNWIPLLSNFSFMFLS